MWSKIASAVLDAAAYMLPPAYFAVITPLSDCSSDVISDTESHARSKAKLACPIRMPPFKSPLGYKEVDETYLATYPPVIDKPVYIALDKYIAIAMKGGFKPAEIKPQYWAAWSDYIMVTCETGLIAAHLNIRELEYLYHRALPDSYEKTRRDEELRSAWDEYDIVQTGYVKLSRRLHNLAKDQELDIEFYPRPDAGKAVFCRLHWAHASCAKRAYAEANRVSAIQELLTCSSPFTRSFLAAAMS